MVESERGEESPRFHCLRCGYIGGPESDTCPNCNLKARARGAKDSTVTARARQLYDDYDRMVNLWVEGYYAAFEIG